MMMGTVIATLTVIVARVNLLEAFVTNVYAVQITTCVRIAFWKMKNQVLISTILIIILLELKKRRMLEIAQLLYCYQIEVQCDMMSSVPTADVM